MAVMRQSPIPDQDHIIMAQHLKAHSSKGTRNNRRNQRRQTSQCLPALNAPRRLIAST